MLYFTACGCFAISLLFVPVDPFIGIRDFNVFGTFIGTELYYWQMPGISDFLLFLRPTVSRVAINEFIILADKIRPFRHIMNIGCCPGDRVDIFTACIYAGVHLHSIILLVAFLCLVHFWVEFAVFVLGRTGGWGDRGIYDRSAVHHQVCFFRPGFLHQRISFR